MSKIPGFVLKRRRKSPAETIFIILMLAYPIIHFIIFWGFVNVSAILRTFQRYVAIENGQIVNKWVFAGLDNFKTVWKSFSDENTSRIITNSIGYILSSWLLS